MDVSDASEISRIRFDERSQPTVSPKFETRKPFQEVSQVQLNDNNKEEPSPKEFNLTFLESQQAAQKQQKKKITSVYSQLKEATAK